MGFYSFLAYDYENPLQIRDFGSRMDGIDDRPPSGKPPSKKAWQLTDLNAAVFGAITRNPPNSWDFDGNLGYFGGWCGEKFLSHIKSLRKPSRLGPLTPQAAPAWAWNSQSLGRQHWTIHHFFCVSDEMCYEKTAVPFFKILLGFLFEKMVEFREPMVDSL